MQKKLILIDGNSLLYRAYYATAYRNGELMRTSEGIPTNAVYGFVKMIFDILDFRKFTHICVAFDLGKKTFRHEKYEEYKGGRNETPDELIKQFDLAKEFLEVVGVEHYGLRNYEADDVIGTMAKRAIREGFTSVEIISGDKDLLQLVDERTFVNITKSGIKTLETFTYQNFKEKRGILPYQVPELKGLMGDSSDNIKGVKGVGEKTALKLLDEFHTVENLYEHIDLVKGKLKDKLIEGKADAFLSKELATICCEAPIDLTPNECYMNEIDYHALRQFFERLEFRSLIERMRL